MQGAGPHGGCLARLQCGGRGCSQGQGSLLARCAGLSGRWAWPGLLSLGGLAGMSSSPALEKEEGGPWYSFGSLGSLEMCSMLHIVQRRACLPATVVRH